MPRVLIVTSMYLPHLAADAHRARVLADELPTMGWDVELLVPGPEFQQAGYLEPYAAELRTTAPIHSVSPNLTWLFRLLGSRSVAPRAYLQLLSKGFALLRTHSFDLVYISAAPWLYALLGAVWHKKLGIPYVVDLHDPWHSPNCAPPRHLAAWKWRLVNQLAGHFEKTILRRAAGIVSVSDEYLSILDRRYAGNQWASLCAERQRTIPFAASERDYIAASKIPKSRRHDSDAFLTVAYTGAGGPIMEDSFRHLCRGLNHIRATCPSLLNRVRFYLYGTEPGAKSTPALSRVAAEEGVLDLVNEHPARLSYLEALRQVQDADGLLVLGVNDTAYSPSKLFLYGAQGKPLLAVMIEGSVVKDYFTTVPRLGQFLEFLPKSQRFSETQTNALISFLQAVGERKREDLAAELKPWMAPAMTMRHISLFNACLNSSLPHADNNPHR